MKHTLSNKKITLDRLTVDYTLQGASEVALVVKNPPAKKKKKNPPANVGDIRNLGFGPGSGRTPRGGIATHFSIRAWRIPWVEDPSGLQSIGSQSQTRLKWLSMYTRRYYRRRD